METYLLTDNYQISVPVTAQEESEKFRRIYFDKEDAEKMADFINKHCEPKQHVGVTTYWLLPKE